MYRICLGEGEERRVVYTLPTLPARDLFTALPKTAPVLRRRENPGGAEGYPIDFNTAGLDDALAELDEFVGDFDPNALEVKHMSDTYMVSSISPSQIGQNKEILKTAAHEISAIVQKARENQEYMTIVQT